MEMAKGDFKSGYAIIEMTTLKDYKKHQ